MTAGVYYWDESLPFNNLTPVGTTTFGALKVLAVAMAPTFATDRAVIATGTTAVVTYATGTVTTVVGSKTVTSAGATFTANMVGTVLLTAGANSYAVTAVDTTLNTLTIATAPTVAEAGVAYSLSTGTYTRVDVNGGAWGAIVPDFSIGAVAGAQATAADIAFPSDFNATTSPIYFIVIADADAADGCCLSGL